MFLNLFFVVSLFLNISIFASDNDSDGSTGSSTASYDKLDSSGDNSPRDKDQSSSPQLTTATIALLPIATASSSSASTSISAVSSSPVQVSSSASVSTTSANPTIKYNDQEELSQIILQQSLNSAPLDQKANAQFELNTEETRRTNNRIIKAFKWGLIGLGAIVVLKLFVNYVTSDPNQNDNSN